MVFVEPISSSEAEKMILSPFLSLGLEITGRQQVLMPLVAAGDVLLVFEIVVPVGSRDKLRAGLAGLEVEPRERAVKAAFHPFTAG